MDNKRWKSNIRLVAAVICAMIVYFMGDRIVCPIEDWVVLNLNFFVNDIWPKSIKQEHRYQVNKARMKYLISNYGNHFEVEGANVIRCVDYPDYFLMVSYVNNEWRDNYAICKQHEELEKLVQEISEPFFGQSIVRVDSGGFTPADMNPLSIITSDVQISFDIFVEENETIREDYKRWRNAMVEMAYGFSYHIFVLKSEDFNKSDRVTEFNSISEAYGNLRPYEAVGSALNKIDEWEDVEER